MKTLFMGLAAVFCAYKSIAQIEIRVMSIHRENFPLDEEMDMRIAVFKSLNRVAKMINPDFEFEMRTRIMDTMPPFPMYGTTEFVGVNLEALAQLNHAAYWLAAEEALLQFHKFPKGQYMEPYRRIDWIDLHRLAKATAWQDFDLVADIMVYYSDNGVYTSKELEQIVQYWADICADDTDGAVPKKANKKLQYMREIYQGAMNYCYGMFLGHELCHYFEEECPIAKPSWVESGGAFNTLKKLQMPGGLYPINFIEAFEEAGDKGGYRAVEQIDQQTKNSFTDVITRVRTKRAAIELMACPMIFGFSEIQYEMDSEPKELPVGDYLNPRSRLLLFGATLRQSEPEWGWAVKVHGEVAKRIVVETEYDVQNYSATSGDVPDEMLNELPPGVTLGWEENIWNEESFICKPRN